MLPIFFIYEHVLCTYLRGQKRGGRERRETRTKGEKKGGEEKKKNFSNIFLFLRRKATHSVKKEKGINDEFVE